MIRLLLFTCFLFSLLAINTSHAVAQTVHEPRTTKEWEQSYQPFQIAGNLYYVGTYDLACYLITTPKGHILINTGLASSAAQIQQHVEALGFKFKDIKILLTTQAHYDHLGAMAAIKEATGAQMMVDDKDAAALRDGGSSDYEMGKYGVTFKPVTPDRLLHDSDIISLGDAQLMMLHHPGHTKGSCSFLFTVKDNKRSYKVLIANMPSIIVDRPFTEVSAYPNIAADYAYTLHAMKKISFDIWLASHASQFQLHEKHKPGDAYNPTAFIDQKGYDDLLNDLQQAYNEKLQQKTGGK